MGLEGKVCIITGGGSGIGRASALMMAEEGAIVIVLGRTASKVEAVRDEIAAAGGTAEAYGLDVVDKPGIEKMVEDVLDRYGKVDVLVNNAGQGTIINVSSMAGVNASPLAGMSYSAAKAAVINFTEFLNSELRNTGIRTSVVIPGEVDTPILDGRPVPPSAEARKMMVTAEDTAEAITLIARLPQRAAIPELVIRPTWMRDTSKEANVA